MIVLIILAVLMFAFASWLSPVLGIVVLAILIFCFFPQLVLVAAAILLIGFAAMAFVAMIHKGLDCLYTRKSSQMKRWEREYAQIKASSEAKWRQGNQQLDFAELGNPRKMPSVARPRYFDL